MIIDCFPYFNEKELLELRLSLLYDKIDKFYITEANVTHSGKVKPFTCLETIDKLGIPMQKIAVLELDMTDLQDAWSRERAQRNAIAMYVGQNDVGIFSDCDEIVNPDHIEYVTSVAKEHPGNILRLPMAFLHNKVSLKVVNKQRDDVAWTAPFIAMKHHLNKLPISYIREIISLGKPDTMFPSIYLSEDDKVKELGWHFSWFGDSERAQTKIDSFVHHDEFKLDEQFIPARGGLDILGRNDHILETYAYAEKFPSKLLEFVEERRDFFL